MMRNASRVLLLALGNDLLSDDAVAFHAARRIHARGLLGVDVIESGEAGFALLELITGYSRVIIIDALHSLHYPAGSIVQFSDKDFAATASPSPHYAGLPDLRRLAQTMGIPYPEHIGIIAMEVEDPYTIAEKLTNPVQHALPAFVDAIIDAIVEGPVRQRVSKAMA
ncbi:MAG: hydrogenase maturation protease [Bacteroidia bacterium]|nr:hydrogenase maturation protease [Bacteroidia bacterium]